MDWPGTKKSSPYSLLISQQVMSLAVRGHLVAVLNIDRNQVKHSDANFTEVLVLRTNGINY